MGIDLLPYKILFKHSYLLAKRSIANRDEPYYIVVILIMFSLMFNVWTFSFIVEGMFWEGFTKYNIYLTILFSIIIFLIYLKNKKYDAIARGFEQSNSKPKLWQSIIYVIFRFIFDAFIMFIAGLYKNGHLIFN